jgi:CheY-like chemotaxis protein
MDDDEMVLEIASKMLDHLGYITSKAEDGDEAVSLYKKEFEQGHPFDIVILDLTIKGGMGGEKTLEKLLEFDPSVIALVSSGNTGGLSLSKLRQMGFKGIVEKPYNMDELKEKLSYILEN